MENPRLIRKRLKSVKNIYKISKALEMVAASRVQKAQDKAVSSKPFSEKIYDLIQTFAKTVDPKSVALLKIPEKKQTDLYLLVSTNRGLCGSLNTNLFKALSEHVKNSEYQAHQFINIGKKGRSISVSLGKLVADYSDFRPPESASAAIIKNITDSFLSGEVDEVNLVYNDFVSALVQEPKIKRILPISRKRLLSSEEKDEGMIIPYNFEPSAEEVLEQLLPFYLEVQLREVYLEAEASEHSARMVAMKNASDNADQLSYWLNLEFNNARQQTITGELADIVTAGVSLEDYE